MPFKSKAQQAYLYSQKPDIAEKFAAETPKSAYKKLPQHVSAAPKGSFEKLRKMMGGKC